jgi:hypothetical protein
MMFIFTMLNSLKQRFAQMWKTRWICVDKFRPISPVSLVYTPSMQPVPIADRLATTARRPANRFPTTSHVEETSMVDGKNVFQPTVLDI